MRIDYPEESRIPALRQLWQEAFGDTDTFLDKFFATGFSADRCQCCIADDTLAAALYWFDCRLDDRPIAYLYAVATKKAFRKQGLCRKLMDNTRQLLASLGYAGILLVPGEPGLFAMYEAMGYETCCHVREFTCRRSEESVALQVISPEEYAARRREFLPAGGVVQENENLQFLQSISTLYAGDGFLYAEGAELLGNTDAAPKILAALGKEKGSFRCPGKEKPFAMYLPLAEGAAPSYFGLAFD